MKTFRALIITTLSSSSSTSPSRARNTHHTLLIALCAPTDASVFSAYMQRGPLTGTECACAWLVRELAPLPSSASTELWLCHCHCQRLMLFDNSLRSPEASSHRCTVHTHTHRDPIINVTTRFLKLLCSSGRRATRSVNLRMEYIFCFVQCLRMRNANDSIGCQHNWIVFACVWCADSRVRIMIFSLPYRRRPPWIFMELIRRKMNRNGLRMKHISTIKIICKMKSNTHHRSHAQPEPEREKKQKTNNLMVSDGR